MFQFQSTQSVSRDVGGARWRRQPIPIVCRFTREDKHCGPSQGLSENPGPAKVAFTTATNDQYADVKCIRSMAKLPREVAWKRSTFLPL